MSEPRVLTDEELVVAFEDLCSETDFIVPPSKWHKERLEHRRQVEGHITALTAERDKLKVELAQWRTWGVVEIAVRNPQVAEYCKHWEGRVEAAERELANARETIAALGGDPLPPRKPSEFDAELAAERVTVTGPYPDLEGSAK